MKQRPMTHNGAPIRHIASKPEHGHRDKDMNSGAAARAEAGNGPVIKKPEAKNQAELHTQAANGHLP